MTSPSRWDQLSPAGLLRWGRAAGALALLLAAGCGGEHLRSAWRSADVVIDGSDADWQGALDFVEDFTGSVGVRNDESKLYLCLETDDPDVIRQIRSRGLTVWFDPSGGKNGRLGLRYPMGGVSGPDSGADSSAEILTSGGERKDFPISNLPGIAVGMKLSHGRLVYELRVPLHSSADAPYAVDARKGDDVGLGIKVAALAVAREQSRGGGGNSGRGGGGGGGFGGGFGGRGGMRGRRGGMGGGGGGGGGRGGGGAETRTAIEEWVKVKLATGPA